MTLKRAERLTPESLANVRDRSLEEAYESHDVATEILTSRLEAQGFYCEDHGDDARHVDEIFYGDGPDQAVYENAVAARNDDEPLFYVEIKSKEDPEWFGRCNLRHFREYVQFARDSDVPVFIWFAYLDSATNQLHRDAFIEVRDTDQISEDGVDISGTEVVFAEEDIHEANEDLRYVEGEDIVSIHRNDLIVDFIPFVHGNDVVELNHKEFRSLPHVLDKVDQS